jgi:hypothetical protein
MQAFVCRRSTAATRISNTRSYVMTSKKPLVRKPSRKIADSRRIRYGAGNAPRVVRPLDAATQDSKAIRFGAGNTPASLRK